MRYRYRLSLYDDDALDQEIVDYLARSPRKQELMRSLMRAGFALMIKRQEENLAYLSSMTDEEKAFLIDRSFSRPLQSAEHSDKQVPRSDKGIGQADQPPYDPAPSLSGETSGISDSIDMRSNKETDDADRDRVDEGETIDFMDILKI